MRQKCACCGLEVTILDEQWDAYIADWERAWKMKYTPSAARFLCSNACMQTYVRQITKEQQCDDSEGKLLH